MNILMRHTHVQNAWSQVFLQTGTNYLLFVVTFCCSDATFVFLTRKERLNGSVHLTVVAAQQHG